MNSSFHFYQKRIKTEIKERARSIYKQALCFDGAYFLRKQLTDPIAATRETAAIALLEDLGLLRVQRATSGRGNFYRVAKVVSWETCLEQAMEESPVAKGMVVTK